MIPDIRCHAILDPSRSRGRSLAALAAAAIEGGATLLQYRDKEASTRLMVQRARDILKAIAGAKVPLIVNDRVDVAMVAHADGVHVGQDDMTAQDVRRLLGPDAILGLTIKSPEHVDAAPLGLLSYVCIGGVFETLSKVNPEPPLGLVGLARLAVRVRALRPDLPVGAIAGITAANAAEVVAVGADGIAAIGEIFLADDPRAATLRLRRVVDAALIARRAEEERR
ncbi:thiamine phosphate synthase [Siculibacillus lacustris]|uniref:Thiamine-phosphate synthase n=1 Tax=Siculibacillus lacustris TaxID=1549641 RepID=A0A4Q9VSY4_9HYPH|nr:thiamine phosphate synthase [Siculibacillus lacustris]TBW38659.1 thiamine phosphate synthase [Siculibacillus lacustris]